MIPEKLLILPENSKCTIKIDGSNGVGRVKFEGNSMLGVLYPAYEMGSVISVSQGETKWITIYNGDNRGDMSVAAVFSGAAKLASGVLASAVSLLYLS